MKANIQTTQAVDGLLESTVDGKPVKNLGWLLRHWKAVESFTIEPHPPVTHGFEPDAVLIAHLKGGVIYKTGFSCSSILRDWLNRPVFRGVPQTWSLAKPE